MRTFYMGLLVGWLTLFRVQACDVCSSGSSLGDLSGITPQFDRHFVGLAYSFQQNRRHAALLLNQMASKQQVHTIELRGRWYVRPRLQIQALLPYQYIITTERPNRQNENTSENNFSRKGLADAQLRASYLIVSTKDTNEKRLKHVLLAGLGAGLPTGKSQSGNKAENVAGSGLPVGVGLWSGHLSATWLVRRKNVGFQAQGIWQMYSPKNGYQYANRHGGSGSVFYIRQKGNLTLVTQAGLLYEYAGHDKEQRPEGQVTLDYTGGRTVSGLLSADVMSRRRAVSLGVQMQWPVNQRQNAATQFKNEGLLRVSLSKFF